VQRRYFGIDHCELGSFMVKSWDLMPSFIDVVLKHHEPREAQHDPCLVKIVAGVEHFLLAKEDSSRGAGEVAELFGEPQKSGTPSFTERTRQPFGAADRQTISKRLEDEYDRLVPLVEETLTSILGISN
jgi:hypothetical protein